MRIIDIDAEKTMHLIEEWFDDEYADKLIHQDLRDHEEVLFKSMLTEAGLRPRAGRQNPFTHEATYALGLVALEDEDETATTDSNAKDKAFADIEYPASDSSDDE